MLPASGKSKLVTDVNNPSLHVLVSNLTRETLRQSLELFNVNN